uniref:Uncharacterized protein n=1 Tax=Romanomermis culicivorax TaxID=13658 RepID=A0A915IF94_ROMCU
MIKGKAHSNKAWLTLRRHSSLCTSHFLAHSTKGQTASVSKALSAMRHNLIELSNDFKEVLEIFDTIDIIRVQLSLCYSFWAMICKLGQQGKACKNILTSDADQRFGGGKRGNFSALRDRAEPSH